MKAEETNEKPALDLMNPILNEGQANAKVIKKVLLNDGEWYNVKSGTFKFYKTHDSVPFIRFITVDVIADISKQEATIECFPATVAGWAY